MPSKNGMATKVVAAAAGVGSDAKTHWQELQERHPTYYCDFCQTPHDRKDEPPHRPADNVKLQICPGCAGKPSPRTVGKPKRQKNSRELYYSVMEPPK